MEKTWRWFGKKDPITLKMLKQIGVEGIVTALHDVENGTVWTREQIRDLREYIESYGMRWSVVESLPVVESIKYAGPDRDKQIETYKQSLRNLGQEGVHTICYNFMPVLDWARTDLFHQNDNFTSNLYFSWREFAYFDIYILKREGARDSFKAEVVAEADELHRKLVSGEKIQVSGKEFSSEAEYNHHLVENIIVKTQGFVNGNIKEDDEHPVELFRELLKLYEGITKDQLRENMRYFLDAIMPVCEEYGMNMCVHPDDPPYQILGLPRIVTSDEDIEWFLKAVDNQHNGLTFCAGSLSSGAHNDVVALARKYAGRTHFVHLRSCKIFPNGDFTEASHLGGRANVVELVRIFDRENSSLPMRVDHGPMMDMYDEDKRGYNAGYSFLGRMFAMGQVQGIMAAVNG